MNKSTQVVTEEAMLLSSLLSCIPADLYAQAPQGSHCHQMSGGSGVREGRRRRRNKGRGGGEDEGGMKKRRLSDEQVRRLETSFGTERKLESGRKAHLASELGLDPKQVAVWFQNRRARWKSKQLEEEYGRLKAMHDDVLLQNCRLEAEVLKLKEQLSEAEKEIRKLSVSGSPDAVSGGSPSSCFSIVESQGPLLQVLAAGEIGVGGDHHQALHNPLQLDNYDAYMNMVDWVTEHSLFI